MPTRDEALAFAALKHTKNPAEIKAFAAALTADHDAIVTYDNLVATAATMPKPQRKALFDRLVAETNKYPPAPVYEDPLFGRPFLALRAKIENFRGLKRDVRGQIILSDDERRARIAEFEAKAREAIGPDADLSAKWGPWVEDCKREIAFHRDYLEGRRKTYGSIWDFIKSDVESPNQLIPKEG